MKKITYILFILTLLASSCKMKPMDPIIEPGEIKIKVSAQEVNKSTKAKATDGFVGDSQIGIFSAVDANPQNPIKILDESTVKDFNYIYKASENSNYWNPIEAPLYFDPYNDMTLYSYYPCSNLDVTPNTIQLSSEGYVVKYVAIPDQSSVDNLQLSDLMYAKCPGVSNVNNNVSLPFSHKLSKIRFSVRKDPDWGAAAVKLTSISVSGANLFMQANLSLLDGSITPVANEKVNKIQWNVDPRVPIYLSSIVDYDIDLIIIPTTFKGTTITFVANDKTFTYELTKEGSFQEATNHIYKVKIMAEGSAQPLVIEPSIADWDVISDIVIQPR